MASFCLIGGRGLDTTSKRIYERIGDYHPKSNCKILFFPQANSNNEKSYANFKALFPKETEIECIYDNVLGNKSYLIEQINASSVLFFGGGHTERLMGLFYKYMIFDILKSFLDSEKLYAGISAGAIMLSTYGMGDGVSYFDNFEFHNFKMINGYGFLPISFCPHYQKTNLVYFDDEVRNYGLSAIALEDDVSIFIDADSIEVVKDDLSRSGYYLDKNNDYLLTPLYNINKIGMIK